MSEHKDEQEQRQVSSRIGTKTDKKTSSPITDEGNKLCSNCMESKVFIRECSKGQRTVGIEATFNKESTINFQLILLLTFKQKYYLKKNKRLH